VPMPVETMLTPGAVTSGLRALSPLRGPPEVKSAKALNAGFASVAGETEANPTPARSLPPSEAALRTLCTYMRAAVQHLAGLPQTEIARGGLTFPAVPENWTISDVRLGSLGSTICSMV